MKSLIVIGCGGHGRIVAEAAAASYLVRGFTDDNPARHGALVDGLPVLGPWQKQEADMFVVAIGDNLARQRVFELVKLSKRSLVTVVSSGASVSTRAGLGAGTVVLAGAVVQAGAVVGGERVIERGRGGGP